jgi:fimbrial isopeptide formation D2 family protein/LPXTG-motif cell wall-anchored protein
MLELVNSVTVNPKSSTPTLVKQVMDTNDSVADSTTGWQDSADYDIGDSVPFKLTAKVAENYDSFSSYAFTFHDTAEKGLTINSESVVVKVDGTQISGSNYNVETSNTCGCSFEVVFSNLKAIAAVKAGSEITVEYTATLNENANIGSTGNVNKAWLTYSNNPNGNSTEIGKTPEDQAIVYTYQVVVYKKDGSAEGTPELAGAGFTLSKKSASGEYVPVGSELKANEENTTMTTFTWSGLDDGDYLLEETTTPRGYNTAEAIYFTISASHTATWTTEDRTAILTSFTGGSAFEAIAATGTLKATILNYTGSTLPSTGGAGTKLFYLIGGILVLCAGALLIAKGRAGSDR